MKTKQSWLNISIWLMIILLLITTISGITSFNTKNGFSVMNLYGQSVELFGSGIYHNDSYFKAPILIGSDFTMLITIVPLLIYYSIKKFDTLEKRTNLLALLGPLMYYAFSISFGVTQNRLQIVYILLTGVVFVTLFSLLLEIYSDTKNYVSEFKLSIGETVFFSLAGLSTIIAWGPDIMNSLLSGAPLERIEMYTTEVTYVLDLAIVSPLVFITLYLLNKKKNYISLVLYRILLVTLKVIGIMVPLQTLCQTFAGIHISIPEMLTKVVIFVLLAIFAIYYDKKNNQRLKAFYQ